MRLETLNNVFFTHLKTYLLFICFKLPASSFFLWVFIEGLRTGRVTGQILPLTKFVPQDHDFSMTKFKL